MRPAGIVIGLAALILASEARAQTGKDLFGVCTSKNPIEQMWCDLYISGFVHGLQAAEDLKGEICIPKSLTGNEASIIFTETLSDIEKAAAQGRGIAPEANPFFTSPQNAALAATLGMKYRCPQKGEPK